MHIMQSGISPHKAAKNNYVFLPLSLVDKWEKPGRSSYPVITFTNCFAGSLSRFARFNRDVFLHHKQLNGFKVW